MRSHTLLNVPSGTLVEVLSDGFLSIGLSDAGDGSNHEPVTWFGPGIAASGLRIALSISSYRSINKVTGSGYFFHVGLV